jgi:hypothetical protein
MSDLLNRIAAAQRDAGERVVIEGLRNKLGAETLAAIIGESTMAWWTQPLQIADANGNPTGRWRLTAKSDEDGGGPFGDSSHDHATAEEAEACERCDEFVASVTGFPSRKRQAAQNEVHERAEYERLKAKFG